MPDREKSIERLQRQIAAIAELRDKYQQWDEFKKWHRNSEVVIEKIFALPADISKISTKSTTPLWS